jgi:non-canonical (house-cleaning) NTP pyrophosphatase
VWVAAFTSAGNYVDAYSSALPVPAYVQRTMAELNLEHGAAMRHLRQRHGLEMAKDTWGTYSGQQIQRRISFAEALRNVFIQLKEHPHNMYRL